ncbi:helix-turn-helix domain-containing protein [Sphingobacterium sp. UBA5670]|uniref:helix-turn-helix domain-containing protein n=1 Tax=Sphingobacterium sp. UBA5670 TaxID=1947502 RepID=UPI0025CF2B5D|nr:helix-turn-helix domain-containing protein [Sphingobacterium sp. UBA5670]
MKNDIIKQQETLNQLDQNSELVARQRILEEFKNLIYQYPQYHWDLQFYLKKLEVSRIALHRLTVSINEAPPSVIAKDIVASEIAKKLASTEIPIKDLTSQYGFSSSASLTRFVKKHTGLSPRKFRALNSLDYI